MKTASVKDVIKRVRQTMPAERGSLELIRVRNGVVRVRVKGSCVGCPVSILGMEGNLKTILQYEIPEIKRVEIVI